MTRMLTLTCIAVVLCGFGETSSPLASAVGQPRLDRPAAQAPGTAAQQAAEVSQAVSAARVFRDAGLYAEAANAMAAVLKKYPANTDAAQFLIDTQLRADKFPDALATYDRYVAARQRPDLAVLGALARADLRRSLPAKADDPTFVALALERLALDGDAAARQSLKQLSDASPGATVADLAPTISLARLKDAQAEAKLGEGLKLAPTERRAGRSRPSGTPTHGARSRRSSPCWAIRISPCAEPPFWRSARCRQRKPCPSCRPCSTTKAGP